MITDNLETTLRIQKNDYGYATITKEGEGFRVRRHTVEPEKCGKYEFTIQEGWVVATEEEAMEIANKFADVSGAPRRAPQRKYCHFCGLPLPKSGRCDECGPQIAIEF